MKAWVPTSSRRAPEDVFTVDMSPDQENVRLTASARKTLTATFDEVDEAPDRYPEYGGLTGAATGIFDSPRLPRHTT